MVMVKVCVDSDYEDDCGAKSKVKCSGGNLHAVHGYQSNDGFYQMFLGPRERPASTS